MVNLHSFCAFVPYGPRWLSFHTPSGSCWRGGKTNWQLHLVEGKLANLLKKMPSAEKKKKSHFSSEAVGYLLDGAAQTQMFRLLGIFWLSPPPKKKTLARAGGDIFLQAELQLSLCAAVPRHLLVKSSSSGRKQSQRTSDAAGCPPRGAEAKTVFLAAVRVKLMREYQGICLSTTKHFQLHWGLITSL